MKWFMQFLLLSALLATGTAVAGWWAMPVIGALYGTWGYRQRSTLMLAALAGAAAWGGLLAWTAATGEMTRLLGVMGAVFRVPGSAMVLMTIAFGGLLTSTAAAIARGMRQLA